MTTGGRSTPSMRGIEKPHTSASTTADRVAPLGQGDDEVGGDRGLAHAALARRDQQARGCGEPGSAKGMTRPSAWPWPWWVPAVAAGSPWSCWRSATALLVGHDGEVEADASRRPSRATRASVTRRWISLRSGQPATVSATCTCTLGAVDAHVAHHAEVDDAAVQLGILDGAEGLDDVGLGDGRGGHGRTSWGSAVARLRISPTAIGTIPAWIRLHSRPPSSPRWSPPSPPRSATRPAARSTSSPDEHADGVTAAEVAERFDLHPNVARHHLDKLAGGGYLDVAVARSGQAGAGRPSKRYRVTDDVGRHRAPGPPRRPAHRPARPGAGAASPPTRPRRMAEEVGVEYGRAHGPAPWATAPTTASARSAPPCTPWPTPSPPTASPPTPRSTSNELRIVSEHCPFGDAAIEQPGDLRRRPRHGQGHARRALRRHLARARRRRSRWATRSASPPSTPDAARRLTHGPALPRPRVDVAAAARGASPRWWRARRRGLRRAGRRPGPDPRGGHGGPGRARGGPRAGRRRSSAPGPARSSSPAAPPRRSPPPPGARCASRAAGPRRRVRRRALGGARGRAPRSPPRPADR